MNFSNIIYLQFMEKLLRPSSDLEQLFITCKCWNVASSLW